MNDAIRLKGGPAAWADLPRRGRFDPWQWVTALLVGLPLLRLAASLLVNPALEWSVVGSYLFDPAILQGVLVTISLALACLVGGLVFGLLIVAMRLSGNAVLSGVARGYIWLFRSVPPLVQILLWYNIGILYPQVTLNLPFSDHPLLDVASSDIIGSYTAALIALTLVQAAYQAEIFRGGLLTVGHGQQQAALALGMTGFQAMKSVVIPQIIPSLLPPTGNQFIHLVKSTAIVSFIALGDLLYSVESIYQQTGKVMPLLVVAMAWYLAILGVASFGQSRLERRRSR